MKKYEDETYYDEQIENDLESLYLMNYKKGLKRRELYINESIDENFNEKVIIPFIQMEKDSTDPIHIFINSQGGSATDGLVLCNLIDKARCPVTIEVLGYAYSMATYMIMAGANNPNVKRVCHQYSFGLIHAGSVGYSGDARKAKQVQAFCERIDNMTKEYILSHSKITEEEYQKHFDDEWYMTSDEMLKYGLVDEIL